MTALRRACAVLVTAAVLVLLPAAAAQAHAYVVGAEPANGSQLATEPAAVRVTFDEPVTLTSATVIDAEGRRVDDGTTRLESGRHVLLIGIRAGLARGAYIASWSVVSPDTHPVGGSIQFGYGVPASAITAPAAAGPEPGWELAVGGAKALVYLGLVLALGLLPAAAVLGADAGERRTLVRASRVGAAVAGAASAGQVVVQYFWQSSASGLAQFATTPYAVAVWARLPLLAAAVLLLPRRRVAGVLLALATLGTVAENGHGGSGAWWRFVSTLLHVAAVTAWLGGLGALGYLLLLRRITAERLRRLPLWSLYAGAAVSVLAFTGVVQAIAGVRFPGALLTTTYGRLLVAKVLLVAVAVAIGYSGHRWIRGQLAAAEHAGPAPGQTARLRRRVRREAAAGAVVVVLSGVLSSITPAEAAYAPQETIRTAIGPYAVTVGIAPARRGPQSLRVTVVGRTDDTALPESLQADLSQTDGPVRALAVSFPYRLPGAIRAGTATPITFSSAAVDVPSAGAWTLTLTIVAGRLEQYTAVLDYRVL